MQFGDQFGLSLYDKEKNWQKTSPPVNNSVTTVDTSKQTQQKPIKSDPIPDRLSLQERKMLVDEISKLATSKNERDQKIFNDLELYCRNNFPIPKEAYFSDCIQEVRHKQIIDDYLRPYRK